MNIWRIKMTTPQHNSKNQALPKKWLYASLAAATLVLGACADNDPTVTEPETIETTDNVQTPIEQDTSNVGQANASPSDDIVVENATDNTTTDDVGVATAEDSELLEETESEDSVSTY